MNGPQSPSDYPHENCHLDMMIILAATMSGECPCKGCNFDRKLCGGWEKDAFGPPERLLL